MSFLDVLHAYGCDPEVLREYDLECESIRRVRGALRIKTPSGYRMLKRINGSAALAEFLFQALEHIYDQFPHVPRFIRNKYADPYVIHETGIFYLADWLPGREADFSKMTTIQQSVQALANFHLASAGFDGSAFGLPPADDFMARGPVSLTKLGSYMAISQQKVEPNAFEELFEYAQPYLIQMLEHAGTLANTEYYRRILLGARDAHLLCHGSFHRQNILLEGDRV
ncbi:MAG: hypothetical protein JWN30_1587, partial [Bacilli bacterium]|nr:hypothetical protein [Bacilli bacterium]